MYSSNIIENHIKMWSKKLINGKSVDEILEIEGVPLWWFYNRFLIGHVLPPILNCEKLIGEGKLNLFSRAYYPLASLLLRKFFLCNEKLKIHFSKKKQLEGDVMFLSYTNHFDASSKKTFRVESIVDRMKKDNKLQPFIIFADPLTKHSYIDIRKLQHTIHDYVTPNAKRFAKRHSKILYQKWKNIDKTALFGNIWPSIKHTMNFFFSKEFIYLTLVYYYSMKQFLEEKKIKALVLTSTNGLLEKCSIAASHKLNLPVIIVQHGIGLGVEKTEVFDNVNFAVFGEVYKKRLMNQGIIEKNIFEVGPAIFDNIMDFVGKRGEKKQILIITGPFIEEGRIPKKKYFAYIKKILEAICPLSQKVIIKLHPREKSENDYHNVIKEGQKKSNFENVEVVTKRDKFYELLSKSSLLINFHSTTVLEAMILDIPTITIDFGVHPESYVDDFYYSGTLRIDINQDIQSAALTAIKDSPLMQEKRKEIAHKFCYKIDGRTDERITELICRLADKKKLNSDLR